MSPSHPPEHGWLSAVLVSTCLAWPAAAAAQWAPGAQWDEPVVVVGDPAHTREPTDSDIQATVPEETGLEPADRWATPQELAQPLDHEAIAAIHGQTAAAVVPVRVIIQRDPLLWPPQAEIEGAATRVDVPGRGAVYLTALALVEGANEVELRVDGVPVPVEVRGDARFGLAVLEPAGPVQGPALPVHPVEADVPVEAFSAGPNTAGATLGSADGVYAWYQLNTVGVTMGYPLVNRRGEVVGIGSHRYPLDPTFTLSVPSAAIEEFLAALEEPE